MSTDSYGQTFTTARYSEPSTIARAVPQSPDALKSLAEASADYAGAAAAFITARDNLNDARARWQECRDIFAKVSEQENV